MDDYEVIVPFPVGFAILAGGRTSNIGGIRVHIYWLNGRRFVSLLPVGKRGKLIQGGFGYLPLEAFDALVDWYQEQRKQAKAVEDNKQ